MYQLSPVFRADRAVVDTSARFGRLDDAVARANAHRQEGRPVRVRVVTRAGVVGDFAGSDRLIALRA